MVTRRRALIVPGPVLGFLYCVGLGSCANLPTLEPSVCGNGVVDVAEDCDGQRVMLAPETGLLPTACAPPGSPNQCRYVWETNVSGCPMGWGAGNDNVCSFSSGVYLPSGVPLNAGFAFFTVGDSNGDADADVVGQTLSGNLEAWYGNGEGVFGSPVELTAGGLVGVPSFGSLSEPSLLLTGASSAGPKIDAVLPTQLGVFAVRSTDTGLDPIAFPTFEIPRMFLGAPVRASLVFNLSLFPYTSAGAALFDQGGISLLSLVGEPRGALIPTTKSLEALVGPPLHVDFHTPGIPGTYDAFVRAREEVVLGFAGEDRVFTYHFKLEDDPEGELGEEVFPQRGPYDVEELQRLTLPAGYVLAAPSDQAPDPATGADDVHELVGSSILFEDQGLIVADLNNDGYLDVLARAAPEGPAPGPIVVVVFHGNGQGAFGPGTIDGRFDGLGERDPDCKGFFPRSSKFSPWPIAVGDLNGDGWVELVGGGGIYTQFETEPGVDLFCPITPDEPFWTEALIGDFNRDGLGDVAAVSTISREVDFRMGTPGGLFNRFRASTANLPTRLRRGDFDGDQVDDLAIIENEINLELEPTDPRYVSSSLSILFGTVGGAPAAAVGMGALERVVAIDVGSSPFDPNVDAIADLNVQTTSTSDAFIERSSGVAVMTGTSQRRMLSPLGLTELGPDERSTPIAIQIGTFRGSDATADTTPDIFALAVSPTYQLEAWIVEGEPGQESFAARHPYHLADADLVRPMPTPTGDVTFDATCASFTSGDLGARASEPEPVAVDEIVGIDTGCQELEGRVRDVPANLVVFLIATIDQGIRPPLYSNFIPIPSDLRNPRKPRLVDVNSDGLLDIVVLFGGLAPSGTGRGLLVLIREEEGIPGTFRTEVIRDLGLASRPLDVAPLNSDSDPFLELAVLTEADGIGIFDVDLSASPSISLTTQVSAPRAVAGFGALQAADVNGDGLADLLVSGIFQTHVSLAVRHTQLAGGEVVSSPGGSP